MQRGHSERLDVSQVSGFKSLRRLFLPDDAPAYLRALFEPDALLSSSDGIVPEIVIVGDVPWGTVDPSVVIECVFRAFATYPSAELAVVLWITDYEDLVEWPEHVLVWRTSVRKSRLQPCERMLPFVWELANDPYPPLPRGHDPVVGFCGLATASYERQALIQAFRDDPRFEKRFTLRKSFWGGAPYDRKLFTKFEQTLRDCHFQVCCRGAGNFSMRFFQTLAAGRIPVLIDTDLALPFPDEIPWSEIVIRAATPESVVEAAFSWFSERDLEAVQRKCALVNHYWFAPSAFGKHLRAAANQVVGRP
jgi:hypothetical protein